MSSTKLTVLISLLITWVCVLSELGGNRVLGQKYGACPLTMNGPPEGACVPIGRCPPADKVSTFNSICGAGLECCKNDLNYNLCANRGGQCSPIGSCGNGIEGRDAPLFKGAEDCNRTKNGQDCCIFL